MKPIPFSPMYPSFFCFVLCFTLQIASTFFSLNPISLFWISTYSLSIVNLINGTTFSSYLLSSAFWMSSNTKWVSSVLRSVASSSSAPCKSDCILEKAFFELGSFSNPCNPTPVFCWLMSLINSLASFSWYTRTTFTNFLYFTL